MIINILFFIISFLILVSAQPDWSLVGCLMASCIGYALFWRGMLAFRSKKGRFLCAFFWFAIISVFHLNWLFADRYVGSYIYLFIVLLCAGLGAQFGLISLFIKSPKEMHVLQMLGVSGGWALLEWGRLFLLSGFSWDPTGLALSATLTGMQMASIAGVFGLSFWVFFTNLLALRMVCQITKKNMGLWILGTLSPYLFGWAHLAYHTHAMSLSDRPPLSALLVQTALMPEQKQSINGSIPLAPLEQWTRILKMLAPYLKKSKDIIVFPEGVVPYGTHYPLYPTHEVSQAFKTYLGREELTYLPERKYVGNHFWAQSLANVSDSDVVIGLEDADKNGETGLVKVYAAAFLMRPFMQDVLRYEKRVLVPMGEFIPFEWCKKILSKYGILDSFTPGTRAKVLQSSRLPIGISICYEETYGNLMREARKQGAEILINLTNDVWFPRSRLPIIHFLHGRLRAVEGGIPLLRACNTGVTCGVDALGRVVGSLPFECAAEECKADVLSLKLPVYHYKTLYAIFGNSWLIFVSSILFSVFCVFKPIKTRRILTESF